MFCAQGIIVMSVVSSSDRKRNLSSRSSNSQKPEESCSSRSSKNDDGCRSPQRSNGMSVPPEFRRGDTYTMMCAFSRHIQNEVLVPWEVGSSFLPQLCLPLNIQKLPYNMAHDGTCSRLFITSGKWIYILFGLMYPR
jgi:hypothetical protein